MKEHKEDIIKLSVSFILLVIGIILTNIFSLPTAFSVIIFLIPYLISGYEVLFSAARNIIKGEIFDENFLMCIASIGAFIIGEYSEAAFVMIFFCLGELLEDIATDNSKKSIKSLLALHPDTCTVLRDNTEISVAPRDVAVGEIIVVKPGEKIALDGIVESGESATNNSSLSGEALPIDIKKGNSVFGGTVNLSGVITVRVTKCFGEDTASKILDAVQNAAEKKSKSQRFITKFAKVYTPAVCIAAILLAVVPTLIWGDFRSWGYKALTFLVVSCPCALVVSVPLGYFAAIGNASKMGILIKGSEYLEKLSHLKTAVFDKTGTLTNGTFTVTAVHPEKIDNDALLILAAAAESNSNHPIAESIRNAVREKELPILSDVREISGEGIIGKKDGKTLLVGNGKLMKNNGISYKDCHKNGTVVHLSLGGEYLGHIVISDTVKPQSKSAVEKLKKQNILPAMLTGDRKSAAEAIAKELGISDYHTDLLPQQKVEILENYLESGVTAFVGDGINDAPVLTRADVGIAMGALGSDAAVEAADIVLMNDNPNAVPDTVKLSKKAQKIVKENIFFSIFVKLAVLLLCTVGIGITDMWMAAFADVGVLIIAVLNSIRAGK